MIHRFSRLAALLAATSLAGAGAGFATAADAPVNVALNERVAETAAAERPLTVMLDHPTGGRFAYFANEGWKFVGRNAHVATADADSTAGVAQPVSLMVDGPTGFVYTYQVEKGWQFAGSVGEVR